MSNEPWGPHHPMNFDNLIIGQTPRTSNESQNFIINEPMDHRDLSFIEPKEP